MNDERDLEFLAERARELLDRQIGSYRTNHAKATTIIGISALFVPIFIFVVENSNMIIQIIAIVPIVLFGCSICFMLKVLSAQKLSQGFNEEQFSRLVNVDYENILLYEIGAKLDSFKDNQKIIKKQNDQFATGLVFTKVAIFLSLSLLLVGNLFFN